MLPGDINVAASILYGGRYKGIQQANQQWGAIDPLAKEWIAHEQIFDESEAQRVFKTAIAFAGTDYMFNKVKEEDIEIVATKKRYLEVVSIEQPRQDIVAEFAKVKNDCDETGYIKVVGVLNCKDWDGPGFEDEDMTDDGDNDPEPIDAPIESFWLEYDILEHCFIGMKMEVTVHELNIGVKFFDYVGGIYCSFHTYLPNEKMVGWKEPSKSFLLEDSPI